MKIVFQQPAGCWEEGFPLGNGRIGAVMYGDFRKETLQINEDTLWSGYPSDETDGMDPETVSRAGLLARQGRPGAATRLVEQKLPETKDVQMYVPFGNLYLEFAGEREISGYRRNLDLDTAVASVTYENRGKKYEHLCFCSAPAQALLYRIRSEEAFTVKLSAGEGFLRQMEYEKDTFRLWGECPGRNRHTVTEGNQGESSHTFSENPQERGMRYLGAGKLLTKSGVTEKHEDGILCRDTHEVTLYFCVRSSFHGWDRHPFTEGADPEALVQKDMQGFGRRFDDLLAEHIGDYKNYFDRVRLDLGTSGREETDIRRRIRAFMDGEEDISLYTLLFDFGRYLLISSSRPGTQPANLQGIWNREKIPPWCCDYTVNINTEMNYWMTGPCGLPELQEPLVRMNLELLENGRRAAGKLLGKKGAACFHNVDLWRKASPATGYAVWAYWPFGMAWMCRNLYEGYLFTCDRAYLEKIFPVMEENVAFCADMLEELPEGLAVCPATSPENTFRTGEGEDSAAGYGNASVAAYTENTLAIIRNLFRDYMEACDILGAEKEKKEKIQSLLERIIPVRIGKRGQILEWDREWEECDEHHRHLSHLYELHPGRGILPQDEKLCRAAEKSLLIRGDEGTGWSLAWKILMWARLGDGEHTERILKRMFCLVEPDAGMSVHGGGVYANLLCAHPPFQIDGNLGYTAGVAEALLQSHGGELALLPALPPAWKRGNVQGLWARGAIQVSIAWEEERISYTLLCRENRRVMVSVEGGKAKEVLLEAGREYREELDMSGAKTESMQRTAEEELDRRLVKIVPSPRQLAYQQTEFYAFIHFTVNTYTDREWGDGTEDEAIFAPGDFDADQWVEAVKAAGMKGLILTCKHHDGFCLWPSKYTEHTVAKSPFRGGKGDVVREVSDACRRGGIRFGIYLSPWDRNNESYGHGKAYNDYFVNQLTELLSGYGEIFSVWFDGACGEGKNGKKQEYDWERYYEVIRRLQPNACISVCGPDIRWCGNEAGQTRPAEWSVVPARLRSAEKVASESQQEDDAAFRTKKLKSVDLDLGSRKILEEERDLIWYPAEVNTSIRPGWFYHASEDDKVRPLEQLLHIYDHSVGGNATFLLNVPPTREGRIHENDVKRLREMGDYLRGAFSVNLLEDAQIEADQWERGHEIGCVRKDDYASFYKTEDGVREAEITIRFLQKTKVSCVVLKENILLSQRIERFAIRDEEGTLLYEGTTVGYKKIARFPGREVSRLRICIGDARVCPTLAFIGVY